MSTSKINYALYRQKMAKLYKNYKYTNSNNVERSVSKNNSEDFSGFTKPPDLLLWKDKLVTN